MFKVKKSHGSMSSLMNPETSSKLIQRKLVHNEKQVNTNIRGQSKSSLLLPKLNTTPKQNQTLCNILDTKKLQKHQVKQLSLSINKYYLSRTEYLKKPFNQLSFDLMSVLQCFSKIQNDFQQLFSFIHEDLMKFLFMTTNVELSSKYGIKEGEIYKKVVELIDKSATKKLKEAHIKFREVTDQKEQLELEYQRQKVTWSQKQKQHLQQIEWYKKISNMQYTKYLQQKVQQCEERILELEDSQRSLVRLRDEYEKQIDQQKDTLDEQLAELGRLRSMVRDLQTGREESQKMVVKLRDRFDQLGVKLIGLKGVIDAVQHENDELRTERTSLVKRAAVTFQELTPRPKYAKLINFTQKQATRGIRSTADVTQLLLAKMGAELREDKFRVQLFDDKTLVKHPKLQQAELIRESTLGAIVESKEELRRVGKLLSKGQQVQ